MVDQFQVYLVSLDLAIQAWLGWLTGLFLSPDQSAVIGVICGQRCCICSVRRRDSPTAKPYLQVVTRPRLTQPKNFFILWLVACRRSAVNWLMVGRGR